MSVEVKVRPMNLSFRVTVSQRPESHNLFEEFKAAVQGSTEVEASWRLSDWIISTIIYPPYPNTEGEDITYEDGGFEVSNIAPADVARFKEIIDGLCKKLGLQLILDEKP